MFSLDDNDDYMGQHRRSPDRRMHSTPEPDEAPPEPPKPLPDDVPSPANAPVEEPAQPAPPIRAI